MTQPRIYTLVHLMEAFAKANHPVSRMWIYRQEDKGNLVLPRSTTNFKKCAGSTKLAPVRVLTYPQLCAIVKAFLPDGRGYYDYRKHTN